MSNLYRGPAMDASYQVSIHLAKRFQRRRLKQELSVVAMFVNGSEINKLLIFIEDLPRTLPTKFRLIWPRGYRGEDFLEINQSETRIACGLHVC
jgi:hypothetical protein